MTSTEGDMPSNDDPIDVREIMRDVRKRARANASRAELASVAGSDPADLRALHDNYDLLSVPTTAGPGTLAVRFFKRAIWRLLTPFHHRQTVFNGAAARLVNDLCAQLVVLDQKLSTLGVRIDAAESQATGLERRVDFLDADAASLRREWQAAAAPVRAERPEARGEERRVQDCFALLQRFRGSEDEIRARQLRYLNLLRDHAPIVDLGCGRGEFLELARDANVAAYGVDADPEAIEHCRRKGLQVVQADVRHYLTTIAEESIGAVFCAQVIEHLSPPDAIALIERCFEKLGPAGAVLFETINPQCLTVFASAFYVDITHVWPYHPELLRFLLEKTGFGDIEVIFSGLVDPAARLPRLEDRSLFGEETEAYNRAAALVNGLLMGPQDYAIVARKTGVRRL